MTSGQKVGVIFLIQPFSIVWKCVVVLNLWRWHMVPFGLPELSMSHAVGLACLVSVLTHQFTTKFEDLEKHESFVSDMFSGSFVWPALLLLIGWVVR